MAKVKIKLWLPVGIWMGTLFYLSSIPNLRVAENNFWDEIIRSGAHFLFYGIGYFLFFRAINFGKIKKDFLLPLICVWGYAFFDEVHQIFVPTRTFQWQDLVVDFSGGFFAKILKEEIIK
ncbi:MAG: VanZ family protein [Microgenomates group bacterium]